MTRKSKHRRANWLSTAPSPPPSPARSARRTTRHASSPAPPAIASPTVASANITVRIDDAAANPDLRVQLIDDAAAADFVLLDDGNAAIACPAASRAERPPRSARRQCRPHGGAVARARRLQDLRALGRFLATGCRRLVRRDLAQCRQDARVRTRVRQRGTDPALCRLTLLSPRRRARAAQPGMKLQRSRRQIPVICGTGAGRWDRRRKIQSPTTRKRARNKAALVLFGRAVVATMAVVSGWLGFLTGIRLQSSNYDPYAYGTGVGALFAAACAVIAFMLMRQRAIATKCAGWKHASRNWPTTIGSCRRRG